MRDCKTCIHSEIGHGEGNGCTAWTCEYINKKEALKVYKEYTERGENMAGDMWMYRPEVCDGHLCSKNCDECMYADKIIELEESEEEDIP